jgi:hypothetical protein
MSGFCKENGARKVRIGSSLPKTLLSENGREGSTRAVARRAPLEKGHECREMALLARSDGRDEPQLSTPEASVVAVNVVGSEELGFSIVL